MLAAEKMILRDGVSQNSIKAAAAAASSAADPMADPHASTSYRRRLIGVVVSRAIAKAAERAGENR